MAESILSKLDDGVVIGSDSSGVGCMEQAGAMIRQAVELQSLSLPRRDFEVHWVCDNDPRCRHVLPCHAAKRESKHCKHRFSDICLGRFAGRFSSMRGAHLHRNGCFRASVVVTPWWRRCAWSWRKGIYFRKGFCCTHDRECDLYSAPASGNFSTFPGGLA